MTQFEYDLVDAGDRVVMLLDQQVRGRSTGIDVSLGKYAEVATFRDGLIVHWQLYPSQAKALAAVGLREYAIAIGSATGSRASAGLADGLVGAVRKRVVPLARGELAPGHETGVPLPGVE